MQEAGEGWSPVLAWVDGGFFVSWRGPTPHGRFSPCLKRDFPFKHVQVILPLKWALHRPFDAPTGRLQLGRKVDGEWRHETLPLTVEELAGK